MYSSNKLNPMIIDQNNMVLPFQLRFENALRDQNILSKCRFLTDLIHESFSHNIKEIQHRFSILVEDIFSRQTMSFGSDNWRLKFVTKENNTKEFETIFYFLCTDGTLFKLIRHLMTDLNYRYEFPISYMPNVVKSFNSFMGGGFTSNFFANKFSPSNPSYLNLDAFEFYMFHFACYITNENNSFTVSPNPLLDHSTNMENSNILYYLLLENYLEFFIPIQTNFQTVKSAEIKNLDSSVDGKSSLWNALSSTTTNFWNLSSALNPRHTQSPGIIQSDIFDKTNTSNTMPQMETPQKSVFNSKMFTLSKFQQNLNSTCDPFTNDIIGSILYKCETVFGIFTEMWLGNSFLNSREEMKMNMKIIPNNFNVSIEQMRTIRIFIKHLHYFANSLKNKHAETQYNSGGYVSSNLNDPLDEMKRNLWSVKYPIQKYLYIFLNNIFDRWPNDSSFRVPLETWLSYIQPWRYVPGRNQSNELNLNDPQFDWKRFVSENLFFYTVLFRQVIIRMSKQLDLNSTYNSLLIYRVLKVFAQNHLKDLIRESEMNVLNVSDMSMSYNRPNISSNSLFPSLRNQISISPGSHKNFIMDSEILPSGYVSIFSPGFREQIIELLLKIAKSLHAVNQMVDQSQKISNEKHSFVDSIINFLTIPDSTVSNKQTIDTDKIRNHLNSSIEFISNIFNIPQQSIETILSNAQKSLNQMNSYDYDMTSDGQNIFEIVDGLPKLTELGRNQILNGSLKLVNKKLPKIIEGNPDEQPVRSFEIGFLVKLFIFISMILNKKFGKFFSDNYDKPNNFYSNLLKLFLYPPVSYFRYEKKEGNLKPEIIIEHLPPRINLRFMASIDFLVYSFVFILLTMFSQMFDCFFAFIFLTFLTFLLYQLCKLF